jgi:hypothetical protein
MKKVRIESYFSIPTDLAAEFRHWPEFVAGEGYNVELRGMGGRGVIVRYSETDDAPELSVESTDESGLFERVLGHVVYALAAHLDTVCVRRYDEAIQPPDTTRGKGPKFAWPSTAPHLP